MTERSTATDVVGTEPFSLRPIMVSAFAPALMFGVAEGRFCRWSH